VEEEEIVEENFEEEYLNLDTWENDNEEDDFVSYELGKSLDYNYE
jgi:hypothetical protein